MNKRKPFRIRRILKWAALVACVACAILNQMTHLMMNDWFRNLALGVLIVTAASWCPDIVGWWKNRRRFPEGHCQSCGYDLTGNASGVCPECGTRIQNGAVE